MNIGDQFKDDAEIIEMYWQRNESAITYTKQKYERQCTSVSNNILHNRLDVEECLNDMYIATWNTIPPHKPNSLKMYLLKLIRRISMNKVSYNCASKRDYRKTVSFEEIENELQKSFIEDFLTDDTAYLTEAINQYLSVLSAKSRAILVLRFWHGMSLMDISNKTGIKLNTVKTILAREMKRMKYYFIKKGVYHE